LEGVLRYQAPQQALASGVPVLPSDPAWSAAKAMLGAHKLRAWLCEQGITWDEQLVAIQARAGGCGLGVWALQDIREGAALCRIPKTAILSRRTTGIADLLEDARIAGGLGLTIACMYEAATPDSPWCATR